MNVSTYRWNPANLRLLNTHMCLRMLVCRDVTTDSITGKPSMKHFDLLPILNDHISTIPCCEICSNIEAGSGTSDTVS